MYIDLYICIYIYRFFLYVHIQFRVVMVRCIRCDKTSGVQTGGAGVTCHFQELHQTHHHVLDMSYTLPLIVFV